MALTVNYSYKLSALLCLSTAYFLESSTEEVTLPYDGWGGGGGGIRVRVTSAQFLALKYLNLLLGNIDVSRKFL